MATTATREDPSAAVLQQKWEVIHEIEDRWKAVRDIELQQENAHSEADCEVLIAAKRKLEFTKSQELQITKLSDSDLHKRTLDARNEFFAHCAKAHSFAANRLIPLCEEIIKRYKMQGVAAKDRPNGQPTVDSYFRSIGLNYSTVRSWFARGKSADREKLKDALFRQPGYHLSEIGPEADPVRRSSEDFAKLTRLAKKIVLIGDCHRIDLRSVANDLVLYAGRKLADAYDNPELDQAAALANVGKPCW